MRTVLAMENVPGIQQHLVLVLVFGAWVERTGIEAGAFCNCIHCTDTGFQTVRSDPFQATKTGYLKADGRSCIVKFP